MRTRDGSGDCYALVQWATNGRAGAIGQNNAYAHRYPVVGGVVQFAPGVLGASPAGHWAYVVGISGNWALIMEQNMYWRGGGYDTISYRYIPITTWGLTFYY